MQVLALMLAGTAMAAQAPVEYDRAQPAVSFAAEEIARALRTHRVRVPRIVLKIAPSEGRGPQSYAIRTAAGAITVLGHDAAGAMYGGLDLAEAIRLGTLAEVRNADHAPYIERRGIKFNIPLDARTPSYSDAGDAAQQNIPEMWNMDFWREFLDDMARHRYNVLSLWSLHPFPSMVKVLEYPDVALDDVMRATMKFDTTFKLTGVDMFRPAMLEHMETVRRMPIADKIRFWRDVMHYAHGRGIEVYIFTWNIFTFGTFGKHGITPEQGNPVTADYFRKSVREMLLTYPLLAGFGVTAGENMPGKRQDEFSKERWLWRTYGEGIRDAKKVQPGRHVRLIHRYHQTGQEEILDAFKDYPDTFDFSYKYSVAHMYSSPAPVFARETLAQLPANLRTWLTVRNDDIYSFRWGDPGYARAYIRNMPGPGKMAGFYMGPDGYIWGREFISTEPESPRELVITKQWFSFMLWGRLSYDPELPDAFFARVLARRFPEADGAKLFAASVRASQIIPQITRFFWGDIDLKWFPEACHHHPEKFYTVKDFMEGKSMPGAGVLSIAEYKAGRKGITPLEVAANLHADAEAALKLVAGLRPAKSKELRLTLGDYEAMAHLGNYYAEKILGATDLAMAKTDSAVSHLQAALAHWKKYAAAATAQYRPQLLTRIGYVDLNAITASVAKDIEIAQNWR